MDVFGFRSYRKILRLALKDSRGHRPRGAVSSLAKALKCHPSLVAHILNGKSHLSCEQAIRAAKYFGFSKTESEYFVELVLLERAGDGPTKEYFSQRILALIKKRENLKERWGPENAIAQNQEEVYYRSWVPMAIHMLVHISENQQEAGISKKLGLELGVVREVISELKELQLLKQVDGKLLPTNHSLHLGKDSTHLMRCHINLRQKAIQEITNQHSIEGLNYSSFITLSRADAKRVRELITQQIEEVRRNVKSSEPEVMYLHCLDFFRV